MPKENKAKQAIAVMVVESIKQPVTIKGTPSPTPPDKTLAVHNDPKMIKTTPATNTITGRRRIQEVLSCFKCCGGFVSTKVGGRQEVDIKNL